MPFRRETTIDFDALPPGLIAFVGRKGAGKTHAMELSAAGTLFRTLPYFGASIRDHVIPGVRDAFSELTFSVGGRRYTALVQCDPQANGGRGKTEAYLTGGAEPVGPNVKDFDAALAAILPDEQLFCASVFAAQGGAGSFFQMEKKDRKALFVHMLGLGHLQQYASAAGTRAVEITLELTTVRAAIAARRTSLESRRRVLAQIAALRPQLAAATSALDAARGARGEAAAAHGTQRERLTQLEAMQAAATRERATLRAAVAQADAEVARLTTRLTAVTATLADQARVRSAAAELATVQAQLEQRASRERELTEQLRPLERTVATLDARIAALLADHTRLTADRDAAEAARLHAADYAAVTTAYDAAVAALATIDGQIAAAEVTQSELRAAAEAAAAVDARRRLLAARMADARPRTELLQQVTVEHPMCAVCPLTQDAIEARTTLAELAAALAALPTPHGEHAAVAAHERTLQALRTERGTQRQRAVTDRHATLAALEADRALAARLPARQAALDACLTAGKTTQAARTATEQRAATVRAQLDAIRTDRAQLAERRTALQADAERLPAITAAAAHAETLRADLARATQRRTAAWADLAERPAEADLSPLRAEVTRLAAALTLATDAEAAAATALRALEVEHARLEGQLTALGDPEADLARLTVQEQRLATDVSDWAALEKGLGPTGVQSLEIEAAGPGVTAIANDLLASCALSDFSLAIETVADKKDGRGQKDVFDIRIIDARAADAARTKGSGGEMVVIEEALRLALAIYNAQRSDKVLQTLWRDETSSALDPESADQYVAMLRRAHALGGFHRVLVVSHQPHVWEQADGHVWFRPDGELSFQMPETA